MSVLKGFEPTNVLSYFEELCKIPHGSGNTKANHKGNESQEIKSGPFGPLEVTDWGQVEPGRHQW